MPDTGEHGQLFFMWLSNQATKLSSEKPSAFTAMFHMADLAPKPGLFTLDPALMAEPGDSSTDRRTTPNSQKWPII